VFSWLSIFYHFQKGMQELIRHVCEELCRQGKRGAGEIHEVARFYNEDAKALDLMPVIVDVGLSWLFPVPELVKDAEKLHLLQTQIYIKLCSRLGRDVVAEHLSGFSKGFAAFAMETAELGEDYGEAMYRNKRFADFLQSACKRDQTSDDFKTLQAAFETCLQKDLRQPEADAEASWIIVQTDMLRRKRQREGYDERVKEISRKLLKSTTKDDSEMKQVFL
jgi:hypothetical protein